MTTKTTTKSSKRLIESIKPLQERILRKRPEPVKNETLIDLFENAVARYADKPFLWERDSRYRSITYKQGRDLVLKMGGGFMALGLKKGDRLALLSEGCNAWILGELAMLYAGGINVPLSVKLNQSSDLQFRLNHADARFILVSQSQLGKIRAIKDQLPQVECIVAIGTPEHKLQDKEISLDQLYEMGEAWNANNPGALMAVANTTKGSDLANIMYTSGTTADPKGVMLTHRNFTANVEHSLSAVPIPEGFRTLLILPLDHCFAHVTGFYTFIQRGGGIATVPTGKTLFEYIKNIPIALREFQPNVVMTVPALAKTFRKNVETSIRNMGPFFEKVFDFAIKVNMAYYKEGYNKGRKFSWLLKPLVLLFDKLMFSSLRKGLGGKLQFFVDGGAYLDVDMQKFWYATGIPMFQGYGLSEATPVISSNSFAKHKLGTSGVPARGVEVTIRDEHGNILPINHKGEIVIRGENVMAGYWKNPEATANTIKDGWLWTGDLGSLDKDGFLNVYGRSKSLLIGGDGEKYSPEGIEESMVTLSPYIDQVMLYNNQCPFTVALVVPNLDAIRRAVPDYTSEAGKRTAIELIAKAINEYKKGGKYADIFPERWIPSAFAILEEDFNEQNELMNSTMKIVRGKVEKRYKKLLDFLITPEGKNPYNEHNMKALNK
ncbi:MAG: AMP-binding protein [Bacteroidales bacterium]|nr:AMP-binding protein [Bacteroidales bacterium]